MKKLCERILEESENYNINYNYPLGPNFLNKNIKDFLFNNFNYYDQTAEENKITFGITINPYEKIFKKKRKDSCLLTETQ